MVCRATGGEDYFSPLHPAPPDQTQERKWQRSVSRQDRSPESAHSLIIVARRLIVKHTPYETCANVRRFETMKPVCMDSGTSHRQRGQMRSPGHVGVELAAACLLRPQSNELRTLKQSLRHASYRAVFALAFRPAFERSRPPVRCETPPASKERQCFSMETSRCLPPRQFNQCSSVQISAARRSSSGDFAHSSRKR
jgi:hypothetical protein